jgi:hypothetical protein
MNREKINPSGAISAFLKEIPTSCEPYGNGHINDTFLVIAEKLQEINSK